jgi:hypothetical protein
MWERFWVLLKLTLSEDWFSFKNSFLQFKDKNNSFISSNFSKTFKTLSTKIVSPIKNDEWKKIRIFAVAATQIPGNGRGSNLWNQTIKKYSSCSSCNVMTDNAIIKIIVQAA